MSIPVVLSWSGGKDSALALEALRGDQRYQVVALLTTVTRDFDRISMHGVRRSLLAAQAEAVGLPLHEVWIDKGADNDAYERVMLEALGTLRAAGIETAAFGDLFLEDIRRYRERLVARVPLTPLFPLWQRNTTELAEQFVERGFRAVTCCVDTEALPETFCGKELTADFFQSLPSLADPCGENGEFHTFVFAAPYFSRTIVVEVGRLHRQGPFVFRDFFLPEAEGVSTDKEFKCV